MLVLNQIQREKGIDQEVLIEAVKLAVVSASRKYYGATADIEATFNPADGSMELYCRKTAVDEVVDAELEISLEEAAAYKENPVAGDVISIRIPYEGFGRIAAQTAKQVILQRVREGERDMIYNEYKDREGELINGTVSRVEKGTVYVDMGKGEGILPRREQVFREVYRRNDRIRAYLLEVRQSARGPQIILSRTHPGLVIRLFEIEVPEIYEGIVEVKAAVREPSGRTKIAVVSHDRDVDPVGACVGMRGSRVQAIVQELRGEKIDIIPWSDDTQVLAANALSPAKISRIILKEAENSMTVVAPDDQLSLAIGKGGQNVRLAAKLVKWRIDIKGESEYQAEQVAKASLVLSGGKERKATPLSELEGLGPRTAELLESHGIPSIERLAETSVETMVAIPGVGEKSAEALIQRASDFLKEREKAGGEKAPEPGSDRPESSGEESSEGGRVATEDAQAQMESVEVPTEEAEEPEATDSEEAVSVPVEPAGESPEVGPRREEAETSEAEGTASSEPAEKEV
ncbi:MAG: transcription termination/antitermination protein NusA [Candidatus Tectomicrobia bacterium]|nr:transcription termination/antitermination protein NusA [Candidatus Tectomicrobia bacterium]